MRLAYLALVATLPLTFSAVARADAPSPALLAKLGEQAEAFEQMRTRASYTVVGKLEELDGDGKVTSTKAGAARVQADGHTTHVVVLRYTEDGKDMTADAEKKARDADEKRAKRPEEERLHMPFLERERAKYVFDEVEHDPQDPSHVRITFAPREPTRYTIEGSAWVDEVTGHVMSASFRMSRLPLFVDHLHMSVEFAATTSLGPAVSKVTVDGGGGIWFFHKHFVGTAMLSGYRIHP
jgi:hypothetical protein